MIPVLLLLTAAVGVGVYAITLAAKHHLDTRTRHEVAFVLALTACAVLLGSALLVGALGAQS